MFLQRHKLLETVDGATNTSYSQKIPHTLFSQRSLDSIHHKLSAQKSLATFIRPTDLIFLSYFPHLQDRVTPNNFNRPSGHITERMMGKKMRIFMRNAYIIHHKGVLEAFAVPYYTPRHVLKIILITVIICNYSYLFIQILQSIKIHNLNF